MNRRTTALAVALTLSGALSGCSVAADASTVPASATTRTPLTACADLPSLPTARCGTLTVPLDRGDRTAGTTSVAFALVPRTDQSRPSLGTIVPNPGGPGTSAIDQSGELFAAALAPILDRRDLLLIDPRGVGRSDPLSCPALATSDIVFEGIEEQRQAIGDCGRQLGDKSRFYGTAAVADDVDAVREALGLDRLDLLGISYGTYLMPVYAQRHPSHVRSVVLSGAYAVNEDPSEEVAATALRRAVTLVCRRSQACAGRTVLKDLGALATRLRRSPTTVTVDYQGRTRRVVLDEWALAGAVSKIYSVTADRDVQLGLADAAAAASRGDLAPIRAIVGAHLVGQAQAADAGPQAVSIPQSWATTCHDYLRSFDFADSFAARRRDYDRHVARLDPSDFAPFSPAAWVTRDSFDTGACLKWPNDPTARPPFGPRAHLPNVPVLVLSGDLDANTPTPAGRAAAAQFPHAKVIEVADAGHTPAQTPAGAQLTRDFIVKAGR
jgi:pimeloyl-ACP methyl ester carboxylesterase